MKKLCKDCEYFYIKYPYVKDVEFGTAVCTKYDLETNFISKKKFKWLSCDDRPKEEEE